MGISGALSALITPLERVSAAQDEGEIVKRKADESRTTQALAQLRQQHQDAINDDLHTADIGYRNAQTAKLTAPPPRPRVVQPGSAILQPDGSYKVEVEKPEDYTPRTLTVDGKPVEGFSDKRGNFYDSGRRKITGSVTPYTKPDAPDKTVVLTQDKDNPDGPGIYVSRSEAEGQHAPAKPKAENAQNVASEALLRSSVSEMNNAHDFMKSYESDLASGKKDISGLSQFLGSVGNSFTYDDPASRAIQNTALTALNNVNPDLARYIRRGLSFAEGEAGISKRPSDFRTKMAAFLSTAASGANAGMISDIQGRRTSILTPLNQTVGPPRTTPPGGGGRGGRGAPPSGQNAPVQLSAEDAAHAARDPAFAAWLKARGHEVP